MEIGNFTTIDEVVAMAATRIPESTREDWQIFRSWAFMAEEKIGPSNFFMDTKDVIENNNGSFCKPDGHLLTNDLAFFLGDTEVKYRYHKGKAKVHSGNAFGNIQLDDTAGDVVYVYEDAHYIHTDRTDLECMRIQFYTVPLDGDGQPLIQRHHIDAIATYIEYQWAMIRDFLGKAGMLYTQWQWKAKKARGKNKMPNMKEGGELLRRWMSMFDGQFNKYRDD